MVYAWPISISKSSLKTPPKSKLRGFNKKKTFFNSFSKSIFKSIPEIFSLKHIFKGSLKKYRGIKITLPSTFPLKMDLRIFLIEPR
jgi:hypothetical protein